MKTMLQSIIPNQFQLPMRYFKRKITNRLDAEMYWANSLLTTRRRFIDVGANIGIYSYYFGHSFQKVEAFEPLKSVNSHIQNYRKRNISMHETALSNSQEERTIYLPIDAKGQPIYGLASIEKQDSPNTALKVHTRRLDSFNFTDVDLIKIDVEGHEQAVLRGSSKTIYKCRPIIIVEIEQRHINNPIQDIFREIEAKITQANLSIRIKLKVSINSILIYIKSKITMMYQVKKYVNNFVFLPR